MIAPMILAIGAPTAAMAQDDGEYMLQCGCPLWWSAPWEGEGTFDEDESLDEVMLENGDLTLLIHEIPIDNGSLEGMIEDRTEALETDRDISELEVTGGEDSSSEVMVGRTWENEDGDIVSSVQLVLVWETNYLLSIEYIAPEAEFADGWESTDLVLLVGLPVFQATSFDDMEALIDAAADDPKTSDLNPDLVEAGVIDEGTYESPELGYEVTWTEDWTVAADQTFSKSDYDQVQFLSEDGWIVTVLGEEFAADATIADTLEVMVETEEESGSEILLNDSKKDSGGYVATFEVESGDDWVIYVSLSLHDGDDTLIVSVLVAPAADFADALDETQDAFSVDGDPVLDYFRAREIEQALD
jgi:hypothetical protein